MEHPFCHLYFPSKLFFLLLDGGALELGCEVFLYCIPEVHLPDYNLGCTCYVNMFLKLLISCIHAVVNGVSMYPSGRGGFRNDGFRGRGYSNGRGYPRNDYAKRNGDVPFRGNRGGDGYQGAYQNGGGRGGPRQGAAPK